MTNDRKNIVIRTLGAPGERVAQVEPGDQVHDLLAALGRDPNLHRVEHRQQVVEGEMDLYDLLEEGDELNLTPHMDAGF